MQGAFSTPSRSQGSLECIFPLSCATFVQLRFSFCTHMRAAGNAAAPAMCRELPQQLHLSAGLLFDLSFFISLKFILTCLRVRIAAHVKLSGLQRHTTTFHVQGALNLKKL